MILPMHIGTEKSGMISVENRDGVQLRYLFGETCLSKVLDRSISRALTRPFEDQKLDGLVYFWMLRFAKLQRRFACFCMLQNESRCVGH